MTPGNPLELLKYFPVGSQLVEYVGKPGSANVLPVMGIKTPGGEIHFIMEFDSDDEIEALGQTGKLVLTFVGGVPPFSLGGFVIEQGQEDPNAGHANGIGPNSTN